MGEKEKNDQDGEVYARAKSRAQETFTLVAQDRTAPLIILQWIAANLETAPEEKLRAAFERAMAMREYTPRKWAD